MNPLVVRSVRIGEGMPKICAPLLGETAAGLAKEAGALLTLPVDLAEWRVDSFMEVFAPDGTIKNSDTEYACSHILKTAQILRGILGDIPLVFTLRTKAEGGKASLPLDQYEKINELAAASGLADLVDVELFTEGERFPYMVKILHLLSTAVIGSSHDFKATPPREEILTRLNCMRDGGADVCKTAVMPGRMSDVLTLLSASLTMKSEHPDTPLIALSMGKYGFISRIAGEYFGSDITFASASEASAPGQPGAADCRYIMNIIHEELNRNSAAQAS